MNRITLAPRRSPVNGVTLTTLAAGFIIAGLVVAPGCKDEPSKIKSGPTMGTVKPEIQTNREVSTVVPESMIESVQLPDFSGQPHDGADGTICDADHIGIGHGLIESGMFSEAMVELERGVFDHPDDFEMRKTIGQLYKSRGDLELAIGHLRAASEQVDDAGVELTLAQCYFDLKDYDAATKQITETVKLDPTSPEPYKLLSRVYQSKSMWKESVDASEEAIARGSDSPSTYNNLGFSHLILGSYDDAVREFEKAVSFDTGVTPQIWNNLGLAYEKKGQIVDAAGAYRAALAGNPTYVKARVNLDRIVAVAKAQGVAIGQMKAEMDTKSLETKVPETESVPETPMQ